MSAVNRLWFLWRYFRRKTPWDTGIVPPEVVALAETLPPGRALDIGCGTGASSLHLARLGWQVTGIDFVPEAIRRARQKAAVARLRVDFHVADATRLDFLQTPYDLAVDVGCLHSLRVEQQAAYARNLARLTCPGAVYLLYTFLPGDPNPRRRGIAPEELAERFSPAFAVESAAIGQDTGNGRRSGWFTLRRIS
jgi:SAM-dependent methyltransferase